MNIRLDFHPEPWQLKSLLQYADVLERKKYDWSHLKHKEDFNQLYDLNINDRLPLERIYEEGAQMVSGLSEQLKRFNCPDYYPTLTSFLHSPVIENIINNKESNYLNSVLTDAKSKIDELKESRVNIPWAIEQMEKLLGEQISLLDDIRNCLIGLKHSHIYKRENEILVGSVSVEKILEAINRAGKRFESLPDTYRSFDEEGLRDNILLALSGLADISVFGEVFNKIGKTDILASENGEKKFIAECKFWRGEKGFLETINQLMSYLTWRDDNVAVIVFVDNVNLVSVINTALDVIQTHPCHVQLISKRDDSWFEYRFSNGNKDINLSLMIYHIPS